MTHVRQMSRFFYGTDPDNDRSNYIMTSVLRTGIPEIILHIWDLSSAPLAPPITPHHIIWEENSVEKPLNFFDIETIVSDTEDFPWGIGNYDFFSTMAILNFVQFCME